jgi:glycosyltransferase involved in cell wall biosynthesis
MTTPPEISVVIPAYNRAASIADAIHSVLGQTLPPTEIVVVDDGSADGTAAAVEAIADPRIRLVRQANGGSSAARNAGIAEARCEWIAFQDSDDEWLPRKLERQFQALAEAPPDAVAVYCGMVIVGTLDGGEGRQSISYHPGPEQQTVAGDLTSALLRTSLISTQTLVARRALLQQVGGFDTRLKAVEDWELAIRLSRHGPIAFVDAPLVLQSFSPNSLTRDIRKRVDSWIVMGEKHRDLFAADREAHRLYLIRVAGGLRQLGNHREALGFLGQALSLAPVSPSVYARIGANALLWAASGFRSGSA